MKTKISHVNYLIFSVFITLFEFLLIEHFLGFYFEGSEIANYYATHSDITNADIPVNSNVNIFIFSKIVYLQKFTPFVSVFSWYFTALFFISFIVFNYFIIIKDRLRWSSKMILLLIIFIILSEQLVNINNSNASILLFAAFTLILFSIENFYLYILSLSICLLACLVRVEYGMIYSFLLISYFAIQKPPIKTVRLIGPVLIALLVYSSFLWSYNHFDDYTKTVFSYERELLDKKNYEPIDSSEINFKQKVVFQKAIIDFIEDRDNIKNEDYHAALKYKTASEYILNLDWSYNYLDRAFSVFQYVIKSISYLFLFFLSLLLIWGVKSKKMILYSLIVISLPMIIMFQAEMSSRFLIPYISAFTILSLVLSRNFYKSIRWLFLIISLPFLANPIFAQQSIIAKKHQTMDIGFHQFESLLQKLDRQGNKIYFSNILAPYFFTPKLYFTGDMVSRRYMGFLFWHSYESFRSQRVKYFKKQDCILSNIEDVSDETDAVLISNQDYVDFLQKYLKYFHHSDVEFEFIEHIDNEHTIYRVKVLNKSLE